MTTRGTLNTRLPSERVTVKPKNDVSRAVVGCHAKAGRRLKPLRVVASAPAPPSLAKKLAEAASKCAIGLGAAASVLLAAPSMAAEEYISVAPPISSNPEVFKAQQALAESWAIAGELFVDSSLNNTDWQMELVQALVATKDAPSPTEAYGTINNMLGKLGDPYTRLVPPKEYGDFRMNSDGALQGVGMLIAADPSSGQLVVVAPLEGGPAERAGVLAGDVIEEINGKVAVGLGSEGASEVLRGKPGSVVNVKLRRLGATATTLSDTEGSSSLKLRLKRESISFSAVSSYALPHNGGTLGYIGLRNFSSSAAADMSAAISDLQAKGASEYILDLRGNPGGLVDSGLDIASMWLDGGSTLVNTVDRDSNKASFTLAPGRKPIVPSSTPLVVLVDNGSASASEILTGALRDNGRAEVLGERSYGKGKIQSVFELGDGSALFVTVAKYMTPNLTPIDMVGIKPDVKCAPSTRRPAAAPTTAIEALQQDTCVVRAEEVLGRKAH
eukprot:CAMPEP_0182909044 /NCGR_PEP_ID=MMETSP0034_2-20130328/35535_1 /TAXON_ID=156128 /ORGANISM="Nephroselmis pyriformis, Strain CCMP717" /LENGTH=499 /DNA_ID=CAMNT_0025045269 /DNA_START=309 /DNA_END=1808 /DNA_ORIENTATION=-